MAKKLADGRKPRNDRIYSTNAERHRAFRRRRMQELEEKGRVMELYANSLRALCLAQLEVYSEYLSLDEFELVDRQLEEIREQKGKLWELFEESATRLQKDFEAGKFEK